MLDDSIRERIMQLQSKLQLVSQDYGHGTMSIILTKHGLAIRWPGEIDLPLATFIRDLLLLDMRERLLAHADREAHVRVEAGVGYRVAGDISARPEPRPEPPEETREQARVAAVEAPGHRTKRGA